MATANFQATTGADAILAHFYIEIEGVRMRYGDLAPSWNPADSGVNQPIKEYFTKLPQVTGQVAEPLNGSTTPHEFTIEIMDVDDEITALFSAADVTYGRSTLAEDLDDNELGIDVADGTQFTAGETIYIDRESMYIDSIAVNTLTVQRGMFGSEAVEHLREDDQGNPRIVTVYSNPPFMYTREVVLCEGRTDLLEADVIKYRGYLDSVSEANGVYTLHCSGYLRRLNCMICESFARTELGLGLWDETLTVWESDSDIDGETPLSWTMLVNDAGDFSYTSGHVIVDEEIIKYEDISIGAGWGGFDRIELSTDTAFDDLNLISAAANRGQFAGEILGSAGILHRVAVIEGEYIDYHVSVWCKPHYKDAEVREILHSQKIKDQLSLTDTETLKASDVILTLLLSQDGDDNNDATYDKLSTGWGAGIPSAKVDKTGIENACAHPSVNEIDFHPFAITEAVDCKEWLEENILRPCHLFFVENDEGKISVARLYSKNEAAELETATALTEDDLFEIPRFQPGQAPLGEFSINMNWHPGRDEFLGKVNVILADARTHYLSTARKFEIDFKTVYDSRVGLGRKTWLSGQLQDLHEVLAPYLRVIWSNFAVVPCPVVEFPVSYAKYIDVRVGKVLTLTSTQTPDLKNSDRGITTEYFQVVEAHPNPERSSIDLVCWMIGIHDADTRLLAPACKVKLYDNILHIATLEHTIFTDGVMYTYDVDAFIVGDEVMFVDNAYVELGAGQPEHATIIVKGSGAGANSCYVQFAASPPNNPAPGDYMVTAQYDDCVAAQKAKWAYLADATPTLGAASDSAHKYDR